MFKEVISSPKALAAYIYMAVYNTVNCSLYIRCCNQIYWLTELYNLGALFNSIHTALMCLVCVLTATFCLNTAATYGYHMSISNNGSPALPVHDVHELHF